MTDFSKLKALYIALIVTTVVGLGLDLELTRLHYELHNAPKKASYCTLNQTVDCAAVELSRYAVLFRVPMSAWAAVFHLLVLGLLIWAVVRKEAGFALGSVGLAALFGLGVSGYMAYISLFVLKKLCLLCTGLYAVALIFAIFSFVALGRAERGLFSAFAADIKTFLATPSASAPGVIVLLGLTGGLVVGYPKLYKPITPIQPKKELRSAVNSGVEKGHPWIGPWSPKMKLKPVDIIEISDYECPYCRMFHLQLRNYLAGKKLPIRLFHMNYPLGRDCNSTLRAAWRALDVVATYTSRPVRRPSRRSARSSRRSSGRSTTPSSSTRRSSPAVTSISCCRRSESIATSSSVASSPRRRRRSSRKRCGSRASWA